MPKLVMMPPQNDLSREYAGRLRAALPDYQIVVPETEDDARQEIADADAAYGWVSPELLPLAHKLRWLQSPAIAPHAGYYYPELIAHPVVVCNPRGIFNDHIGQHIMLFVLALARGLPFYMEAQAQRRWEPNAPKSPYVDLATASALIVGVGGIGQEAARLCAAFGMRVVGVDARWEYDVPSVEKHAPEELDALLPAADFVIVTTPHTPETEGMWNARRFQLMKKTAYFINIGRGKTTKLDDLVAALESGEIGGCGLDVFETEPLPPDHKLWTLPNVLLTPHIAAEHAENVAERRFEILLDNARRFAANEPLRNVVDKAAWY
ncbi:MAG TPA: D-2-hydroxyacid dehydrogenase [Roseiflexaceae bacterium]|jgi:phosphoglycerate dehydrogenase-like enzyme|nr:D-2-hydroxyacid dehydrogenase [Roseiflexaceae bacterium]